MSPLLHELAAHASQQRQAEKAVDTSHVLRVVRQALLDKGAAGAGRDKLRRLVREAVDREADDLGLPEIIRVQLVMELMQDITGYGPIQPLLDDPEVSEVIVNGPERVYVERGARLELTEVRFRDESHLRDTIEKIVGRVGRRIDESSPLVDARLTDGSRVNAVLPPVAVDHPLLTIRKFAKRLYLEDLLRAGYLTQEAADLLRGLVTAGRNVLVSGNTGSGKTTLLNVIAEFIPSDQRIVTIEDSAELKLHQASVVRLESRPPNIEGKGEVKIRDLVRNALRMRPDWVVVGEVRGGEALDMLQAMNTGHQSMSTLHANSARDAVSRLETMAMMAEDKLPVEALRRQIGSAVHALVQIERDPQAGVRRVVEICAVSNKDDEVQLERLWPKGG